MSENPKIRQVENGTKISWDRWLKLLENYKYINHTDLAIEALRIINEEGNSDNPEWWAQSVAVTYEQEAGIRIVGQRCDGDFSTSTSKTLIGDMDSTLEHWVNYVVDTREFKGISAEDSPRISKSEKWRYWKINLSDGSMLNVNIQNKAGGEKSTLSINHDKISTEEERNSWKEYWKEFLKEIKKLLKTKT